MSQVIATVTQAHAGTCLFNSALRRLGGRGWLEGPALAAR